MPTTPSPAQSEASRLNGARPGPASEAGKARSALNGVRHGLCGRTFFLLPDEDPAEFREHEAMWLAVWSPRDLHEHEAAAAAIRAMWREIRADRLEAAVLTDLFAAGEIADDAERQAAKAAAMKALGTLLRYRGRIEREHGQAMEALDALRQRRLARPSPARPHEPEPPPAAPLADTRPRPPSPCGPRPPASRPHPGPPRRPPAQPCRRANPSAPSTGTSAGHSPPRPAAPPDAPRQRRAFQGPSRYPAAPRLPEPS